MPRPDGSKKDCSETPGTTAESAKANEEAASIASYIADMSDEMAKLASRCDMPMLCYFLNLARAEADMRARELGGYSIDRSA
ncbi:hypothetical protein [Methylocystis sp. SC2]|uniref:hypothetical protein n=1 Tax=Methylocystis sp. (strain SC2) TaxID=187303 RepID=UPI00027AF415|nr:hypothetical protein [Methylocystis sp. SC2]CCJ09003.1 Hypothetical protein BN69_3552 [Methylocystis sp. SC2]